MTEKAKEWVQSLFDAQYQRALQVGEVITDYFGESLVDVQKRKINTLYFPRLLREAVSSFHVIDDEQVRVGNTVIPRKKWEEDKDKIVDVALDECYFNAVADYVNMKIISYLDANPTDILIRFPKVTVTNEYNKSIDITELYAGVRVTRIGTLGRDFSLFRAEYPLVQFLSNYAHSHMPNNNREWQWPCLGSGPIGMTQNYLRTNFDLDRWGLFCFELAKYVTVESVSGGPFHRLENVGNSFTTVLNLTADTPSLSPNYPVVTAFVRYYLRTQTLKVAYSNGTYVLGVMPLDFIIDLTNCFSEWFNKEVSLGCYIFGIDTLKRRRILMEYITNGRHIYRADSISNVTDIDSIQGQELFIFKGRQVRLNITNRSDLSSSRVLLLNISIAAYIATKALRLINYYYGQRQTDGNNSSEKCFFL